MVRAGLIRKVAPGIYTYGNLALRAIRKFENLVRDELDRRGCQEILMPMVQPAELWKETGRWKDMGDGLLKFKNRNDHEFCLGATHEEVVTDYVRRDVKSYRDLPVTLYQVQTKYRDEVRPRFGLMRGREFIMKDAYSFDVDQASALKSYERLYEAYSAIFKRLKLDFRIVQADAGNIGGSQTHEFQVLAAAGEDHLMVCNACSFAANIEIAPVKVAGVSEQSVASSTLEKFSTPGLKTIEDLARVLKTESAHLVKTLFFATGEGKDLKPVCVLLKGTDELNPVKLKNLLGLSNPPLLLNDQEVRAVTGANPGSCGPVALKIPIYMDQAVAGMRNLIVGANEDDFHLRGVEIGRDFQPKAIADLRTARAADRCPECENGQYSSMRGIEVGHVFYLGTKYSKSMQAQFLAPDGSAQLIEMGCYGIGISRTVQAAIEQRHDADGILWPISIAPFHVHLAVLDPDNEEVMQSAEILYRDLQAHGLEVLMDDRIERPGVKFKDADLLGLPIRINIGARGLQSGEIEIIRRDGKEMRKVQAEEGVEKTVELFNELRKL